MSLTIQLADLGFGQGDALANGAILQNVSRQLAHTLGATVIFPPGVHPVATPGLRDHLVRFLTPEPHANREEMINPVLKLEHACQLTLQGMQTTLVFEGLGCPIQFAACSSVTMTGLTLDMTRSIITWGEILSHENGRIRIRANRDDLPALVRVSGPAYSWDPQTRALTSFWAYFPTQTATFQDGILELPIQAYKLPNGRGAQEPGIGHTLIVQHGSQECSMIHCLHCADMNFADLTLHASCGFGVLTRGCGDMNFTRIQMIPRPGAPFGVQRDGIHCIGGHGLVTISDSTFIALGDDAFNIRGTFLRINAHVDAHTVRAASLAPQDGLPESYHDGDTFLNRAYDSLAPGLSATAATIRRESENPLELKIRFHQPIAQSLPLGSLLENHTRDAALRFINCHVDQTCAHGGRVMTRDVLIENSTFTRTFGPAIDINSAYAPNVWLEARPSANVTLRNVTIKDCGTCFTNEGVDGISIRSEAPVKVSGLHQNLRIEDCCFESTAEAPVLVSCAHGVTLARNRVSGGAATVAKVHHTTGYVECDSTVHA